MKRILLFVLVFSSLYSASAQEWEVPANYKMKKKQDFEKYQSEIVGCVNWLETTPINQQKEKRKDASAFLMIWLVGTDYVSMSIQTEFINYSEKNPDLLFIFMGGWAKFAIENPDQCKNQVKGTVAGLEAVTKFYQANPSLKEDKAVEKLIGLQEKSELETWVSETIVKK